MSCARHLWDLPDGLQCVTTGPHITHVYVSDDVPDDKHADEVSQEDA